MDRGCFPGAGWPRKFMEKIERLARLEPSDGDLSPRARELFKILRGFVVLDWILRQPNDLGKKKSEVKFEGLMERARKLMSEIQAEVEGGEQLQHESDKAGHGNGVGVAGAVD